MKLKVRQLSFSYEPLGRPVLEKVGFSLEAGRVLAVVGPNGSGKTTLLRCLNRTHVPSQGEILVNETDVACMGRRRLARTMAVVPQATESLFSFTVEETVSMGRYPHLGRLKRAGARDRAAVEWAMSLTGTRDLAQRPMDRISGGERQRAIIARALAQKPEILLMDEPISHLDINYQLEILGLIRRLSREQGLTIVVVLHDLGLAARYSDRMLMLLEGRVEALGRPQEVLTEVNLRRVFRVKAQVDPSNLTVTPLKPLGRRA